MTPMWAKTGRLSREVAMAGGLDLRKEFAEAVDLA
jgi:hypothetical protein